MVSSKNQDADGAEEKTPPIILSEGARVALNSVFARVLKAKLQVDNEKSNAKRPRSNRVSIILTENQEVNEEIVKEKEEQKKAREAKKVKEKFETNALVIPDAATGAQLEKELLATATKGAVALFNAVSKAQKAAQKAAQEKSNKKKKGAPVSKESFMDMMRKGVSKSTKGEENAKDDPSSESESSEEEEEDNNEKNNSGAKWLKEDYFTTGSKKLKDWDREAPNAEISSSSGEEVSSKSDSEESEDDSSSDS